MDWRMILIKVTTLLTEKNTQKNLEVLKTSVE